MKILINGGGIAGFALALFLHERGLRPVVLERASAFAALGHLIALKADGVHVLDRLGIRARCAEAALPMTATLRLHNAAGRPLRETRIGQLDGAVGGYLMLRRSDLHAALYERVRDRVEIRFGQRAASFTEDGGGVAVTLGDGATARADVLIGADGVHSAVRRALYGQEGERPLGGSYIALEVPRAALSG